MASTLTTLAPVQTLVSQRWPDKDLSSHKSVSVLRVTVDAETVTTCAEDAKMTVLCQQHWRHLHQCKRRCYNGDTDSDKSNHETVSSLSISVDAAKLTTCWCDSINTDIVRRWHSTVRNIATTLTTQAPVQASVPQQWHWKLEENAVTEVPVSLMSLLM